MKRKKVKVQIWMDKSTIQFLKKLSRLSQVSRDECISVLLANFILASKKCSETKKE